MADEISLSRFIYTDGETKEENVPGTEKEMVRIVEKTNGFSVKELFLRKSTITLALAVVFLGSLTGVFFAKRPAQKLTSPLGGSEAVETEIGKGATVGSEDKQTFRDHATGVIEKNKADGKTEGTHRLIREGGESQTAYLISSVVDLDSYIGKKVEVWGETNQSRKVSWLMDIGRIKILE